MRSKIYDLCVSTRKFQENGSEKNHYENIGAMFDNDEHKPFIMLKAHFNPAAIARKDNSDSIFISMFVPKELRDKQPATQHTQTTRIYDLAVTTGQYTQNGQTKNRYFNIGSMFENDKGRFIALKAYFNPAAINRKEGSESILVSCFTPKNKQEQNSYNDFEPQPFEPNEQDNFGAGNTESEIPF